MSKIIEDGRELEHFFEQQMGKWLPNYSTKESDEDERLRYPLKRPRSAALLE